MKLDNVQIRTRADYAGGLIEALESLPFSPFGSDKKILLEAISSRAHIHFIHPSIDPSSAICVPDGASEMTVYAGIPTKVCFNYKCNEFALHSGPRDDLAPNITPGEMRPFLENTVVNCPGQHAKSLTDALRQIKESPFVSDYSLVIEASSGGEMNYIYPREENYHGIVSIPKGALDVSFNPVPYGGVFLFTLGELNSKEHKYTLFLKKPSFLPIRNSVATLAEPEPDEGLGEFISEVVLQHPKQPEKGEGE
ncbi:hypothetical protein A3K73_02895 [Candidatus Pacearchaeota archaeon RBG_13_36_9]|nr:MAG: hypothetical protein A3K73_02895 [Candidatus Pacearchaeota archaeon RBG_13_36_9]